MNDPHHPSFIRRYVFSLDHKVIGLQYMFTSLVFLMVGFTCVLLLSSFLSPGGAAQSGWTSYPPLSIINQGGQTVWLIAMTFIITSSLFGSINFIVTTVNLRAEGLSWMRLPLFVWAQFITAI